MPSTYKDFEREPSKPHQCMHESDKDGRRCRATAMHNEYMCYHHRSDDIPTVIQNDPFLIERLDDRDSIQSAVTQVAARLACNHMDFKRASLLLQSFQVAASNLLAKERLTALRNPTPKPSAATEDDPASAPPDETPHKSYEDYTLEESSYLSMTVLRGEEPTSTPRPATLTHEIIEDHLNWKRKACKMPPVKLAPREPVPASPAQPPTTSPDVTPTQPHQPATNSLQPATLPTLQAVAGDPDPAASNLEPSTSNLAGTARNPHSPPPLLYTHLGARYPRDLGIRLGSSLHHAPHGRSEFSTIR